LVGTSIISGNLGQTFNILKDPTSWGQFETPRVVNSTDKSKIVFSFEGERKAVATFSSWNSYFTELEIVISGVANNAAGQLQIKYWNDVVDMLRKRLNAPEIVVASSPGKVNIYFAVGALLKNGFHEVASCYQALSLRERVLVELSGGFSIDFSGPFERESQEIGLVLLKATQVPCGPQSLIRLQLEQQQAAQIPAPNFGTAPQVSY
jgi:hypothetical protein